MFLGLKDVNKGQKLQKWYKQLEAAMEMCS